MSRIRSFLWRDDAATSVEYAVMLAMILMGCLAAVTLVGQQSAELWADNETGLQAAFQNVP